MNRRRDVWPLLWVLLTATAAGAALAAASAQGTAPSRSARANTWAARSSTGLMLAGTWTVTVDKAAGTAMGRWTLADAAGRTVAEGGWSAAKSPTGWAGGWRAVAVGRNTEYAGSWKAALDSSVDAPFADLFATAAQAAVNGTWQAGRQSGQWSIRAASDGGVPPK